MPSGHFEANTGLPLFLKTADVARETGLSASTLSKLRAKRDPDSPPFVRLGSSVRYPRDALTAWAERNVAAAMGVSA